MNPKDDSKSLRERAERSIKQEKVETDGLSNDDILKTIHELRVHQIELEMQNKELLGTQTELEQSRSKYSDLFDFAPFGYFVLDKKGNISEVNLTGAGMIGIKRSQLIKKPFTLYVDNQGKDTFYFNRKDVLRTGINKRCEFKMIRKNGGTFFTELLIDPVTNADGIVTKCRIAVIDITEHKATEKALNKIALDLAHAQEVGNMGSWRLDIVKNELTWSDQNHLIFGIPKGTPMTYETFLSTVHPDDKEYVDTKWKAALIGEDYDIEHRIIVDGKIKWVREKAYLEFDDKRVLSGGFGITQDISERKRYEEQIQNLARFPEENPFPVLRIKSDGTILYTNLPGQVLLEQWKSRIGQKVPQHWRDIVKNSLRNDRYYVEKIICGTRIFSVAIAPVQNSGYVNLYGRDISVQEQIKDELRKSRDGLDIKVKQRTAELEKTVKVLEGEVKQRILAQDALQESEEKYRSLVEFSPEAVCVLTDEKITFANTMALKLIKASSEEQVIGKSIWDFIHPDFIESVEFDVKELLQKKNKIKPKESKLICLDGSTVEVEASATYIIHNKTFNILIIFHDITERKLIEGRRDTINSLLELFISKSTKKEYLDTLVEIISCWSDCRCVGVRLINDENYIPYEAHVGFSDEFLTLEKNICLKTDSCLCVRAVCRAPEPQDKLLLTVKGSFRSNDTRKFINSVSQAEKKRYRGNCFKFGFASLAVVPVYYGNNVIGAIHLADTEPNKVPLETVEFLEVIAMMVGEAVHRFKVEELLRTNEKRLIEAQRIAHLGNWEWNIETNKLWWSDEVYRIFGLKPKEFGGTYEDFLLFVHPEDRVFVKETINQVLGKKDEYNLDYRVIRPDNEVRIIQEKAKVTYDENHEPEKITGTVYDITEQKQKEQKIQDNQQELRALTAELQLAEERERRRIAQDLHDSVGQILSFSGRELKNLQKDMPEKTAESIREITNQLNVAVEQTRTLSFDLSPSILYDLGFEVAIEDLVDKMFKERNIQYRFECCSNPKPLSDEIKILLYRSVREVLINSIKYSDAAHIRVSLFRLNSEIYIQVEDDGIGFDVSIFDNYSTQRKGFGIFSIRERLNHIGGRLEIISTEGKGAKVTLIAPLNIEK